MCEQIYDTFSFRLLTCNNYIPEMFRGYYDFGVDAVSGHWCHNCDTNDHIKFIFETANEWKYPIDFGKNRKIKYG